MQTEQHQTKSISLAAIYCCPHALLTYLLLLLSPKADTVFYRPSEGGCLSRPKHWVWVFSRCLRLHIAVVVVMERTEFNIVQMCNVS